MLIIPRDIMLEVDKSMKEKGMPTETVMNN
jgi:hypothetical protein